MWHHEHFIKLVFKGKLKWDTGIHRRDGEGVFSSSGKMLVES